MTNLFKVIIIAICGLMTSSTPPRDKYSIAIMREKWTGLTGSVDKDDERIQLERSLWHVNLARKPDGVVVIPSRDLFPKLKPFKEKTEQGRIVVSDPVVLQIRGKKVEFSGVGTISKTVPSENDGFYLGYSLTPDTRPLTLSKTAGKATEWKVVDGEQTASRSPGEFQFRIYQTSRFRLEAANRPGWFLTIDKEKRLVLSDDPATKHLIELEIETSYDDESDGK